MSSNQTNLGVPALGGMASCTVMPGLVPGIHVFLSQADVDGRDTSAFTRVFDALCPAMTMW